MATWEEITTSDGWRDVADDGWWNGDGTIEGCVAVYQPIGDVNCGPSPRVEPLQ